MNESETTLWARLESFDIDGEPVRLPFVARLARENGWTIAYAKRVVFEYKRFVFLAMVAGHPVTPSEEVDQAWHLHLVYVHSYWERMTKEILPRPLLHGPTKGGKDEGAKFEDWYARTLESYQRFFGEAPPSDIWPPSSERFGKAVHYRRVNTQDVWLVPRKPVLAGAKILAAGLLTVAVGDA